MTALQLGPLCHCGRAKVDYKLRGAGGQPVGESHIVLCIVPDFKIQRRPRTRAGVRSSVITAGLAVGTREPVLHKKLAWRIAKNPVSTLVILQWKHFLALLCTGAYTVLTKSLSGDDNDKRGGDWWWFERVPIQFTDLTHIFYNSWNPVLILKFRWCDLLHQFQ